MGDIRNMVKYRISFVALAALAGTVLCAGCGPSPDATSAPVSAKPAGGGDTTNAAGGKTAAPGDSMQPQKAGLDPSK